jgi:hypothetical protein
MEQINAVYRNGEKDLSNYGKCTSLMYVQPAINVFGLSKHEPSSVNNLSHPGATNKLFYHYVRKSSRRRNKMSEITFY